MTSKISLAVSHPEIAKQWHPTKNGILKPSGFSAGSGKKIWWRCDKGPDHEWKASINHRVRGQGCPICAGRKAVQSNCLATTHPEIAKQWHPSKNGELKPLHFTAGSNKRVWWKCDKAHDHEWQARIADRAKGQGCSVCAGKIVVLSNSLATTHPETAKQWHPTKNGKLGASDVTAGSGKRIWWKCNKGPDHEWQARIADRAKGQGCSVCAGRTVVLSNCLATTHPDIAKQWHSTKNGELKPTDVTAGSHKKVWWKCDKGPDHEWQSVIASRIRSKKCSICTGQTVVMSNCLATIHPEIAKQWHPTKNGSLKPTDVTAGSNKRVWWKCDKGPDHEWIAPVADRVRGQGCSVCVGRTVVLSNCLSTTHPEIARTWHPIKNGKLRPTDVTAGSHKRVWWKCDKGIDHEWQGHVFNRVRFPNCPICIGQIAVPSNCLAATHPEIAKQWHPSKNGKLKATDVTAGSGKLIWWKCNKGIDHEWRARIAFRVRGQNCSVCAGKKVVQSNCLSATHPKIAKQWHPTKNGELSPVDVTAGSNKKVWWKCDKDPDHEWRARICHRTRGHNCPFCTIVHHSKEELIIIFELKTIFRGIKPNGAKIMTKNKVWAIDIYIPEYKLGIEYDGSYWHRDKLKRDIEKTRELKKTGINIIRIRQKPLQRISENDISAEKPFDGKSVVDELLKRVMNLYNPIEQISKRISHYLSKETLQNEKGLEKYIDYISRKT